MATARSALAYVERPDDAPAGVAVIRLDHPPVNALTNAVSADLAAAVQEVAEDAAIRAVVVYGGEKAFAAGSDVREFQSMDTADVLRDGLAVTRAVDALARVPKPTVAAVTGYALGGGSEVALAADFRVSADDARWGQPEILLGIIPGAGGTQRLPRLIGPARAKELIFSGRMVGADEAHQIGLVDLVVPKGEVLAEALSLAGRYAAGPAAALASAKAAIDTAGDDIGAGLALERSLFAALLGTEDARVGIESFLEHGPGKASFA